MNQFEETAENEDNTKNFDIIKDLHITNALDIGACIGNFTKFLAKHAKGNVYAFEPSPYNFRRLVDNTRSYSNVFLYNVAISNHNATNAVLFTCPDDIGMSRLYPSKWCEGGEQIYNVMTVTIDSLSNNVLKREKGIDFVKIDVEGYEYYVLMGMLYTLTHHHPTILMEFHPPSIEEAGSNPKDIWNFLINDEQNYSYPTNCQTGQLITSYEELDKQTRNTPAVNLLFV